MSRSRAARPSSTGKSRSRPSSAPAPSISREADALNYVAGYCVCNDVSERNFQTERLRSVDQGQVARHLRPGRPVAGDQGRNQADVQKLSMWLDVNGQRRQTGSTSTMIFSMAKCISYVSQFMTLLPGDIVTTGTPPGVGARHEAADLPQCRRRRDARHRRPRRAAPGDRRGVSCAQPRALRSVMPGQKREARLRAR